MADENTNTSQTLVLFKPDAVSRGVAGEILSRFEKVGLKIVGLKIVNASEKLASEHYFDLAERASQAIKDNMVKQLTSGPVIAMVLEGVNCVEIVRKMVGSTEPRQAAVGTIRGDFAHASYAYADSHHVGMYNLIHATGVPEEAEREINLWFTPEELVENDPTYTKFTL